MMTRSHLVLAALLCTVALPAAAQTPPLRTGVDGTFAPHAFTKIGGGLDGFNVELFQEVARRMGRELTIDAVNFSGLVPGLMSGRYDFIAAPTTVTKERAESMLFTSGYLWTAFQFGIKKGSAPITSWDDLKGRAVAVNKGTPYEDPRQIPGREARLHRPGLRHPARRHPGRPLRPRLRHARRQHRDQIRRHQEPRTSSADLVLAGQQGRTGPRPFRKDERHRCSNQMQDALDCMKQDGTIAKLSEKWFGQAPAADDLERVVTPRLRRAGHARLRPDTAHPLVQGLTSPR